MINVSIYEVNETYDMIEHEKLDVHTIALSINFPECVSSNLEALNERIHKKTTTLAGNLVSTGQGIEADFGIPIVDKCISVTPIALMSGPACRRPEDFVIIAKTLDMAAEEVGVNLIGGYSAFVNKSMTRADKNLILFIPQALSQAERVCSSVNVGSIKTGIDMDTVELMGRTVTKTAEATRDHDSFGYARLVISCNAPDDSLFMAGAFHGVIEFKAIIDVGTNGPGVAKVTLAKMKDVNFEVLCETIKKAVLKITRTGQLVVRETSRRMSIPSGVIDLSLTPTPSVGDSIAEILEEIELERVGTPGVAAALAMLNDQVKKGDVTASFYVDGLDGAFILASENQGVIDVVSMGALIIEKLEAMTYVCSAGLDTIAIPGDTPFSTIAGIIADGITIGTMNQKVTAVRLIPVVEKKVGETAELGGLLGYTPVMPVNTFSCRRFVTRGGKISTPIHSFKN